MATVEMGDFFYFIFCGNIQLLVTTKTDTQGHFAHLFPFFFC